MVVVVVVVLRLECCVKMAPVRCVDLLDMMVIDPCGRNVAMLLSAVYMIDLAQVWLHHSVI